MENKGDRNQNSGNNNNYGLQGRGMYNSYQQDGNIVREVAE